MFYLGSLQEIFSKLKVKCIQYAYDTSELYFDFGSFYISFFFEDTIDVDFENEFKPNPNDRFLKKLNGNQLKQITLSKIENTGTREDIDSKNPPESLCFQLYQYIKILNFIDTKLIENYLLKLVYNESDFMCELTPTYKFEIHLNIHLLNPELIKTIISKIEGIKNSIKPYNFYWYYYKQNKPIPDDYFLKIINTSTKVRRLGYIKVLVNFFELYSKIPSSTIDKKFERFAEKYLEQIQNYKNNKGLIKVTKNGISAKPYISFAKELGLINMINKKVIPGKKLRVYMVLINNFGSKNIFDINYFDKLFFYENILAEDFLFITLILEYLYIHKEIKYTEFTKVFKNLILNRIQEFKKEVILDKNSKQFKSISKIEDRIANWSKEEIYLEHILMPRINWLLDLDLILVEKENKFVINEKGIKLFENFCFWNDINCSRIISPKEFLSMFSIHVFDSIYLNSKNKNVSDLSKELVFERIDHYLKLSFNYFKTLAPNRVTASQAIDFTRYSLFFNDQINVSFKYIENTLNQNEFKDLIYKYQPQYFDGYIQKRRM